MSTDRRTVAADRLRRQLLLVIGWLGALAIAGVVLGRPLVALAVGSTLVVAAIARIAVDLTVEQLPLRIVLAATVPIVASLFFGDRFHHQLVLYLAAGPIGLLGAVDLHAFTTVRLGRRSTVVLATLLAATVGAAWAVLTWAVGTLTGSAIIATNTEAMSLLIAATGSGALAGVAFDGYYATLPGRERVTTPVDGLSESRFMAFAAAGEARSLSRALPVSARIQVGAIWSMRAGIATIVAGGVAIQDVAIALNAGVMLAITFLPAVLRRRYGLPFDPGLVLWVTVVVFLHVLGSAYLYDISFWYHNLTHPASATLIGALVYLGVRILDARRPTVHVPPRYVPGLVLVGVIAVGVFWEVGEFGLDLASATLGLQMPLAQYGLDDTMSDLVTNAVGGLVFIRWGIPFVTGVTEAVIEALGGPVDDDGRHAQVAS